MSMLTMTPKLMETYRRDKQAAARAKIAARLRDKLGDRIAKLSDKQLDALADEAIRRAGPYGIGTEQGSYFFAACMVVYGRDFDSKKLLEWPEKILDDPGIRPRDKVRLLDLRIFLDTQIEV